MSARTALPALLLAALVGCGPATPPPEPDNGKPRLAVLLVFDQLRADYLDRWRAHFGPDGFNRLRTEGAYFTACRYPYATTVTAAGHAALSTGCSPDRNGIVGNSWYDRAAGSEVIAVSSSRYTRVPPDSGRSSASTDRLLAPTAADALKEATGGKGKVVAVSLKDRSAVLPGGKRADACYWLDSSDGKFVTSTAYREVPHDWVKAFNDRNRADAWFDKTWDRVRPDLDYVALAGPDDQPGEGKGIGQGVTFPHPLSGPPGKDGSPPRPGKDSHDALTTSPFGNDLLLEFAAEAIRGEKLGTDNAPDFLSISFSSNDLVGHSWGPDSQEVLDTTLRSDKIVADLLTLLDTHVGRGRYVLVLSADHGVCPLPEVSRAKGNPAALRLEPKAVEAAAEVHLGATFGDAGRDGYIERVSAPWVYLDRPKIAARGITVSAVARSLADWFRSQPGFAGAYTADELVGTMPAEDATGRLMQRSFLAGRCGDVGMVTAPYCLYSTYATGTSHGTPHDYDRHVPLIAFGAGIRSGERSDPVTPQAAAVIWPAGVGTPPPAKAEVEVPAGLFQGR